MIIKILTIFLVFFIQQAKAEIIENEKIFNKTFDIWNISCEDDEMLNDIRCRLFVEITAHTTLFINPQSNENKILLISNDGYYDRKFFIKIDNNKLIESQIFANNKYGIVNFSQNDINTIYSQLMKGQNFYIRLKIIRLLMGLKKLLQNFLWQNFKRHLFILTNK